ncbi:response regulator [Sulfidibacter corallicola]|uniref:Response regulator n=1 Tax=Sulfidibacter corallicola TaxID=2818388 RepID=A0A8A4TWR9_SULCO|nr:response regulator [Sulfidibacter corallicola]
MSPAKTRSRPASHGADRAETSPAETARRARILIVEDDPRLGRYLVTFLAQQGYQVDLVDDGCRAAEIIPVEQPDLVVLDLMLPGKDGLTICREVRTRYDGLILMFTARDGTVNQVVGLEMGADEYLIKPVEPELLAAKVRALLRRRPPVPGAESSSSRDTLRFDGLEVDRTARTVMLDGRSVSLTCAEFELLVLLAERAGEVLSRDEILMATRGIEYDGLDRGVDVKIAQLRRKLDDRSHPPRRIKTVRARGYVLVPSAW